MERRGEVHVTTPTCYGFAFARGRAAGLLGRSVDRHDRVVVVEQHHIVGRQLVFGFIFIFDVVIDVLVDGWEPGRRLAPVRRR